MTSLFLPAPTRKSQPDQDVKSAQPTSNLPLQGNDSISPIESLTTTTTTTTTKNKAPSYDERCRAATEFSKMNPSEQKQKKLFVPRSISDFDDGGSFPEIHVAQYPRHLGNPHLASRQRKILSLVSGTTTSATTTTEGKSTGSRTNKSALLPGSSSVTTREIVNVQTDSSGKKDYTSLVKSGTNSDKIVYAKHSDLKGHIPTENEIALPTQQEEEETAKRTSDAINALLSTKIALNKPTGSAIIAAATSQNQEAKTQFLHYTPNENTPGYNPTAAKRVIQMVPAQIDPMMPPKHKHTKAPRGPADDFVPVLHAPPEKLTKEEKEAWNIPACISNWKNTRGYTIPLDKRLAADGRGLRDDTTINSNFATFSESLYLAERQAREEVRMRALVQKRQVESERERRERELRELAMKARMERSGATVVGNTVAQPVDDGEHSNSIRHNDASTDENYDPNNEGQINLIPTEDDTEDEQSNEAAMQREKIRQERRKELEKEFRMEKHRRPTQQHDDDSQVAIKKARLEGDRDISEKIALGVHVGLGGGVDGRLYNQNAGLDSGFGADDEYNTYTKPMFDRDSVTSSSIYRPTRGEGAMDADEQYSKLSAGVTAKFQPDKGFSGAESSSTTGGGRSSVVGGPRNAPVQFEKGGQK